MYVWCMEMWSYGALILEANGNVFRESPVCTRCPEEYSLHRLDVGYNSSRGLYTDAMCVLVCVFLGVGETGV